MFDKYRDASRIAERYRFWADSHEFLAESFPNVSLDFGPGSMAAYLGSDIIFKPGTVWFTECVDEWEGYPPLSFDPDNKWFSEHIRLFRDVKKLAGDDYYLAVPDIMENIDVLASLRGAQNTIYDMVDEPEEVEERIRQVQSLYYRYYDSFFDLACRDEDGVKSSCYTVFQIWGRGRTVKLQCDFSAMMSPKQFRQFIQPALDEQSNALRGKERLRAPCGTVPGQVRGCAGGSPWQLHGLGRVPPQLTGGAHDGSDEMGRLANGGRGSF